MAPRSGPLAQDGEAPPIEFGPDALVWATWLYYAESLTQNDVARVMGISRASVANALAEARRRGLVTVTIARDVLAHVEFGKRLAEQFALDGALVVPAGGEADPQLRGGLRKRLGIAAAQALAVRLRPGMILGVAWGRTLLELARALPEKRLPDLDVVQVSGSSLGEADSSPEACTALIAARLGARCSNFHAPAVVTTRGVCEALLAEPTLRRHMARIGACDAVVYGVGELDGTITWSDPDLIAESVAQDYVAAGAVGVLIGRFIDGGGVEVDGPLGGRQIGMALDDLSQVPIRICVAGGAEKIAAIRATLEGRYATHLVTDAVTAATLLGDE